MLNYPVIPASQARSQVTLSARLGSLLASVLHASWLLYRRWKTVRELQSLDDRMLKDIGLDRSEIRSVAANRGRHSRYPSQEPFSTLR